MFKTFKYRIYPTSSQSKLMNNILEECRWLYNSFVIEKHELWNREKKYISFFNQASRMKEFKSKRPSLKIVHSQILQNVGLRVDKAFRAFYKVYRFDKNRNPPKIKRKDQYKSFTYPKGNSFKILSQNKIKLGKIGKIKIKYHRNIEGEIRNCTVKKESTGKWFVYILCNDIFPEKFKIKTNNSIGIDVGLHSLAVLSNGTKVENLNFYKRKEILKAKKKRNYKTVSKIREKILNKKRDYYHKKTKEIINKYDIICIEDLSIKNIIRNNPQLKRRIYDASWRYFLNLLVYKANNVGKKVIKVDPSYTTLTCSNCGNIKKSNFFNRQYRCIKCCNVIGRDLNAAKNILSMGLHTLLVQEKSNASS